MTTKQRRDFNQMYNALRRIWKYYETPQRLRETCETDYGLEFEETIEMAYENIQMEAKMAVKGIRAIPGKEELA